MLWEGWGGWEECEEWEVMGRIGRMGRIGGWVDERLGVREGGFSLRGEGGRIGGVMGGVRCQW